MQSSSNFRDSNTKQASFHVGSLDPNLSVQREQKPSLEQTINHLSSQIIYINGATGGALTQRQKEILILMQSLKTEAKALEHPHTELMKTHSDIIKPGKLILDGNPTSLDAQKKIFRSEFKKKRIAIENFTQKQTELQAKIDTLATEVSQMQAASDNRLELADNVRTQIRRNERAVKKFEGRASTDNLQKKIAELMTIQRKLQETPLSVSDDLAFLQEQKDALKTLRKEISKLKRNMAKEDYNLFHTYINKLLEQETVEIPNFAKFTMVASNYQKYKEVLPHLSQNEQKKFADLETLKSNFPDSFQKYYDQHRLDLLL